jgi:hypothetical protein
MSKRTYSIYTLVCKNKLGAWSDLQGFGCFEDEARAAAIDWAAKGLATELRIDTYAFSKGVQAPVASRQTRARPLPMNGTDFHKFGEE